MTQSTISKIIALVSVCFENNISSSAWEEALGLNSEVTGKDEMLKELQTQLSKETPSEIKFEVYCDGELVGYERIGADGRWERMVPTLNPEHEELWTPGVMDGHTWMKKVTRRQML
jgi:hypothetical protein